MKWRTLTLVACMGCMSMVLPASAPHIGVSVPGASVEQLPIRVSVEKVQQMAQAITVKVLSADVLGSGILIQKQGSVYTVLTNAHVLRAGEAPYRIQTPDGRIYGADLPKTANFQGYDLALLQFGSTDIVYAVASLATSPVVGDEVFAAGFPFEEKGFRFTSGKVSLVLEKALEGGYQIGYTNDIEKGMSGGPLLNRQGEVVGVNGMHAYPLWDVPSMFQDGSYADRTLQEKIDRFSWAVPMERVKLKE